MHHVKWAEERAPQEQNLKLPTKKKDFTSGKNVSMQRSNKIRKKESFVIFNEFGLVWFGFIAYQPL